VLIDYSGVPHGSWARVVIEKQWRDDVEVSFLDDNYTYSLEQIQDDMLVLSVGSPRTADSADTSLHLCLPEMFDVKLVAHSLNLRTVNKSHGNFEVNCVEGVLELDKVRGNEVSLNCGSADITVKKLLEGDSSVTCRSFDAKMVNGDKVNIFCEGDIKVGAMYAKLISAKAVQGSVSLGSVHGNATVEAGLGAVKVGGLDGSANIVANRGNVSLLVNKLNTSRSTSVRALSGSVEAMVAPTVQTRLLCSQENSSSRSSVTIMSSAFQGTSSPQGADGILVGGEAVAVAEGRDLGVGKINIAAAESQSLQTHLVGVEHSDDKVKHIHDRNMASLELKASGHIRVETTSWIDSIRRKYFKDGEGPGAR